jgi:BlaI family transcriptional regulator, penicillinase repressor
MESQQFGRVQMRILQVLWKKNRASAREITDALNEYEPIAHSTVQTLIRTLEQKNAVAHVVTDNRTFIYHPLVKNESVVRNALGEFVNRIFNGSIDGLVSYLVRDEKIPPEEMKQVANTFISKIFGGSAEELIVYLVQNKFITTEVLNGLCEKLNEPLKPGAGISSDSIKKKRHPMTR